MQPPEPDPRITRKSLLMRLKMGGPTRDVDMHVFYQQYSPIIRGFARNVGVKTQDAEDIIHDVITGFFAVAPRFNYDPTIGRFRGYLKTCVFRLIRDKYRGKLSIVGRPIEELDADALQVENMWNDRWESEMLHLAMEKVRQEYLTQPPQPERSSTFRAFEQLVLLERAAEAVAKDLNMPIASVYQAKSRVSKAVRIAMQELDDATG